MAAKAKASAGSEGSEGSEGRAKAGGREGDAVPDEPTNKDNKD